VLLIVSLSVSQLYCSHDVGVPLFLSTLATNESCVFAAVALGSAAAAEFVGPEPGVGKVIADLAVEARGAPPGPVPVVTQEEADRPHPPALDQRRRLDLERLLARLWVAVVDFLPDLKDGDS
jgi:hypothetical protein